MSDAAAPEASADQISISLDALHAALNEMTALYSTAMKDLIVHRAVIVEQHARIGHLEAQLASLKAAATTGTVIQLDSADIAVEPPAQMPS